MREVEVGVQPIDRFSEILGDAHVQTLRRAAAALREDLRGAVVWNVNSTDKGGGVAELLHALVAYARGLGVDARWMILNAPPAFFRLTKRLHHALHGSAGDGSPLGESERLLYDHALRDELLSLAELVRPGDVVILHDPQTVGLAPGLRRLNIRVIWRCHIGTDETNDEVRQGWAFLRPYLSCVDRFVFSRKQYVPDFLSPDQTQVIPPTIDPFSSKNEELAPEVVRAVLVQTGIVEGPTPAVPPVYCRDDGTPARVDRCADVMRSGRAPTWDRPLVTQVSRWDRLKDPLGVLQGFARLADPVAPADAHLVLAGPSVKAVADDPEGADVFEEVLAAWRHLPHHQRAKIHLVNLPMADIEENGVMVNALQRHSAVIVQKSLREGFGLTVSEAMWKGRAVVASAVGGILDQVEDGVSGLLLHDPEDLDAFAELLRRVLEEPPLAARLGQSARARVSERFLGLHSLFAYAALVTQVLGIERREAVARAP